MKHITRRSKKDENAEEKSFVIASAPSATTILGQGIHDIKIKQELCKPPTCNTLKDALQKAYE
ncbi:hypothetical protein BpHYR1_009457 [Brachionus plicatilis]|uniref:Uncharacterized protein n=1 Tax=Brachionus plicatilis TaxID=10195 RepID=A0A3M7QEV0_BRAPC|nr:hypothetical protein BpHYR1_009457 [Brachionus plicatilis]